MSDVDIAEASVSKVVRRLKEARIAKEMSKNRLAKLAGVDPKTVGFIEREERSPTLFTLVKLARALEVELGAIIAEAIDHATKEE